jgi:coatomer protein complex subunit alpha (xenin)
LFLAEALAYLTAATHGLNDEAEELKNTFDLEKEHLPEIYPGANLLQPPPPINQQESNWPLLTVTKGFFEGAMAARGAATGVTTAMSAEAGGDEEGWGDDADLVLDEGVWVITK